ncbi:hypothetical protein [Streptomyces sp. NPDC058741]|uniref:hypothetical protein n=1 Tax=unclassified Streptomyces TaxID=2593676 RepID=UPI0036B0CD38
MAELKQQLLDQAAEDAGPVEADEERPASVRPSERHARLKRAREMAEGGKPQSLTVQELLGRWGAAGRGLVNELTTADVVDALQQATLREATREVHSARDLLTRQGRERPLCLVSEASEITVVPIRGQRVLLPLAAQP